MKFAFLTAKNSGWNKGRHNINYKLKLSENLLLGEHPYRMYLWRNRTGHHKLLSLLCLRQLPLEWNICRFWAPICTTLVLNVHRIVPCFCVDCNVKALRRRPCKLNLVMFMLHTEPQIYLMLQTCELGHFVRTHMALTLILLSPWDFYGWGS